MAKFQSNNLWIFFLKMNKQKKNKQVENKIAHFDQRK